MTLTIWHNPRCSKSRQTLALLEERGAAPTVRRYLDVPPTAEEITDALTSLGITDPRAMMRRSEPLYREQGLAQADADTLIAAMAEHPRLIERPIVFSGPRAVIGRPPETALSLLN